MTVDFRFAERSHNRLESDHGRGNFSADRTQWQAAKILTTAHVLPIRPIARLLRFVTRPVPSRNAGVTEHRFGETNPTASCEDSDDAALSVRFDLCPTCALREVVGSIAKVRANRPRFSRNKAKALCEKSEDDAISTNLADCRAFALKEVVGSVTKLGTDGCDRAAPPSRVRMAAAPGLRKLPLMRWSTAEMLAELTG